MTDLQIIDADCNWESIWTKIMWHNSHMQFSEFQNFPLFWLENITINYIPDPL